MAARELTRKKSRRRTPGPVPATEKDVQVRVFAGHTSGILRAAMPADGRFALTSGRDGTVRKWDLQADDAQSEIVARSNKEFCGLALTSDGSQAVAGDDDGTVHFIDVAAARVLRTWQAHPEPIGNLAFLADGQEVLSAAEDHHIRRWDAKSGKLIAECKLPFRSLFGVAASANGSRIVGAAFGEGLALWSGPQDADFVIFRENVGAGSPIGLPADGRFAFTGTKDGTVTQWDLTEGRRVAAFEGHSGFVSTVVVTPDGRFCASAGVDRTVRLWAADTGQCLAVLHGHMAWVPGLAITPDARRIASVSDDHTLRVWDVPEEILARAAGVRRHGFINAKVVLLGDSGVGKTGLALRLWHDRWEKTESTHGMEIQRLVLPESGGDADVMREVWLWDLAGQPDYRLTHQLFMDRTALALLVFDPQNPDIFDTVSYWQSALRKVTRVAEVPGILVAARCDRPGLRVTTEEIRAWAETRGLHGPVLTAAKLKKDSGAEELRALIAKLLPWDRMEFRSTMQNFPALKDAILAVRDDRGAGGVVVTPAELEARVRKAASRLAFTSEDLRAVTGLLAGEGVLHALPYGDLVVLQPSWVNSYASTLVKMAGEDKEHLGHVPLAAIQPGKLPDDDTPRLPIEDERQLLPALVALFLERALAWKQETARGTMLVFPSYVRLPRPEPPPRPGRTVLYRFTGPLEEIYSTLVVRLHYSGLFTKTTLYRQAVDFHTATGKLAALTMKETGERGELEIYFGVNLDPDVQASFQRFVDDHLKAKAANVERLRNFFCPQCGYEAKDREVIDALIADGATEMPCQRCFTTRKGVIVLNDVLEQQFTSNAGEAGADRARRKASEEITTASMEGVMVGEVSTVVFGADQIYRTVPEPDEGIDGEIEFRNRRGRASGLTYRVQLKSGDSHLKKLKDGTEKFPLKPHYEELWAGEGTVPVLLVIRTSDGRLRYVNATEAIVAARNANPSSPVKQIVFNGADFDKEAVLRLRKERLGS